MNKYVRYWLFALEGAFILVAGISFANKVYVVTAFSSVLAVGLALMDRKYFK